MFFGKKIGRSLIGRRRGADSGRGKTEERGRYSALWRKDKMRMEQLLVPDLHSPNRSGLIQRSAAQA